jgi:hypothetical protein
VPVSTAPGTADTSAPHRSSALKLVPWIGFGVAAGGLVLGGVTGILAISKHSTLSDECKNGCGPGQPQSDLSAYHTMGTLSTVGFIIAGVGAAAGITGVILLVTQPKTEPTTGLQVTPVIGLGSLGATGTF